MRIDTQDLRRKRGQDEATTRAQNIIKGAIEQAFDIRIQPYYSWMDGLERLKCPMRARGCGRGTVGRVAEMLRSWGNELNCPCHNKYCPLSQGGNHA